MAENLRKTHKIKNGCTYIRIDIVPVLLGGAYHLYHYVQRDQITVYIARSRITVQGGFLPTHPHAAGVCGYNHPLNASWLKIIKFLRKDQPPRLEKSGRVRKRSGRRLGVGTHVSNCRLMGAVAYFY